MNRFFILMKFNLSFVFSFTISLFFGLSETCLLTPGSKRFPPRLCLEASQFLLHVQSTAYFEVMHVYGMRPMVKVLFSLLLNVVFSGVPAPFFDKIFLSCGDFTKNASVDMSWVHFRILSCPVIHACLSLQLYPCSPKAGTQSPPALFSAAGRSYPTSSQTHCHSSHFFSFANLKS